MYEFSIINIMISIAAILTLAVYMHEFIKDKKKWYEEIGQELYILSIVPVFNAVMLVAILIRYWQAINGKINPRYN